MTSAYLILRTGMSRKFAAVLLKIIFFGYQDGVHVVKWLVSKQQFLIKTLLLAKVISYQNLLTSQSLIICVLPFG